MTSGVVYLPIEYESRELDSRLMLTCRLLEEGVSVVIGQQWMIYANLDLLPKGVIVFKSANLIHHAAMRRAKENGHFVISFEEESLAHANSSVLKKFFSASLFKVADAIMCVGTFEEKIIRDVIPKEFPVHVVGNGRIEILKPQYREYFKERIDYIKNAFGKFILVNTNFTLINSRWKDIETVRDIEVQAGALDPTDKLSMARWEEHLLFEQANQKLTLELIQKIVSTIPDVKVVIRPHPGEFLPRWKETVKDISNVTIAREGSHVPWTLASELLIHTSCTTGFEAFVAGRPVISLNPMETAYSRSMLANLVTKTYSNLEEAYEASLNALASCTPTTTLTPEKASEIQNFVWNYDANESNHATIKTIQKYLIPGKLKPKTELRHIKRIPELNEKISISPQAFAERIENMRRVLGINKKLDVIPIGDSLFHVRRQRRF